MTVARVVGVTTNYVSITGVTTVPGVVEGNIPQVGVATLSVPDLALLVLQQVVRLKIHYILKCQEI